ncbi:MAG: hypothetical protein LBE31_01125 [Deltaproteobacteria bacterium]|jgi:hypothetical protein|nr:hypothetical protein [Deltaproteobacteria bacterium]
MVNFSRRLKTINVIGLVWIIVSVAVYILAIDEPTKTQKIAFVFLIISEIVTIAVFDLTELGRPKPPAFKVGAFVSGGLYFVFAIATAIIHLAGIGTSAIWLSILEIVWIGLLITSLVLFGSASFGVAQGEKDVAARSASLDDLLSRLNNILNLGNLGDDIKSDVKKIIEEVTFFDRNSKVKGDEDILKKVEELATLTNSSDPALLDTARGPKEIAGEILALLNVRRGLAVKRGGF